MGVWIAGLCFCLFLPLLVVAFAMPRRNVPAEVAGASIAAIDGGVIRYQMSGEGTHTIVFLHGFNQNLNDWDAVWAHLGSCSARRLRVDIPGFGASQFDTENFGLPLQTQRLVSLLDALNLTRVTVVGSSMGGALAVWLAAQHPERVAQLGLFAPSGYPGSLRYAGAYGRLLEPGMLKQSATWIARTRTYKYLFPRSAALQALTTTDSYGPAWREQLGHVQSPVFLAWSRSDRTARAETAETVRASLQKGTLFWFDDGVGHAIPSRRPALTAEIACKLGQGISPVTIANQLRASAARADHDDVVPAASPQSHR